ncbi:hypothetical protein HDU92_002672 [Lobulomyces angularis]|nr:hypothetical protein HDU92_002672 [Lobulomyces angularis]
MGNCFGKSKATSNKKKEEEEGKEFNELKDEVEIEIAKDEKLILNSKKVEEKFNFKDFEMSKLKNEKKIFLPNVVPESLPISIEDCEDCEFYIFSTTCQITVDSFFLRDCQNSTIFSASSQFRTRDCHDLNVFLYCSGQPSIESSKQIFFTNNNLDFYKDFNDQMLKFNFNVNKNDWKNVHDFSKVEGNEKKNYELIEDNIERRKLYFKLPPDDICQQLQTNRSWEN